ncbi:MAG: hypothetical protein ABR961_13570 [Thermoanaerobaculaceae bacterium]
MKTRGSTPNANALLFSFAGTLQERMEADEVLQAACARLQTLGFSALVRVELLSSADPSRVVCADRRGAVPQWSLKDVEILHSAGIAGESSNDANPSAPQPRRRQPR